ncbi:MAG TPA: zf-HC2 domain-containing protein [Solirubrobacteraceae bacterium]|nr:zf-HC2 domain-containing protein [Solirubrobacteraceae bacterium]
MTCRELAALVTERLEGTLSARQRARVEAHLAECGDCVAFAEQLEQVVAALATLGHDDAWPSAVELDALLAAFRARPHAARD